MSDNVDFMSSSKCSVLRIYSGIVVLVLYICKQLLENELWVEKMTEQGQVKARALFTSTGVDAGRAFGPPVILALQRQKDKGSPQ